MDGVRGALFGRAPSEFKPVYPVCLGEFFRSRENGSERPQKLVFGGSVRDEIRIPERLVEFGMRALECGKTLRVGTERTLHRLVIGLQKW